MTTMYTAAFDIAEASQLYGFGTLTMDNGAAAGTAVVLTLGSITSTSVAGDAGATRFWVWDEGDFTVRGSDRYAADKYQHYSAATWAKAVDTELKAAALAAGWNVANIPYCTFSTTNGVYAFGTGGGSASDISLAWSTDNGRALFGFADDVAIGETPHTGTLTPLFVIRPTIAGVTDPTVLFEPGGIASRAACDDGRGFGLDRYTSPLHRDWVQQHETLAKTIRLEAATSHPFTFQALHEHCRGKLPFLVGDCDWGEDETEPLVFSFRPDGMAWRPEPATPRTVASWHIPFRCVQEGVLLEAQ